MKINRRVPLPIRNLISLFLTAPLFLTALLLLTVLLLAGCGLPTPEPTTTPTVTLTTQPTLTPTVTSTPSPTPTLTPTVTPTLTPAVAGMILAPVTAPIIEMNLSQMRVLGEWGRGRVDGIAWSPVGGWIAVTTPMGVFLYNPASLNDPLQLQSGPASQPVFSADGRYLAVDVAPEGSRAGMVSPPHAVQVWDLGSGSPVRAAVLETGGQARALAFQAGDLLVLARRDAGAQFQRWDLALGVRTKMAVLNSGETAVEAAFSADLLLAATRGATGPVRIWRLSDGLNLATTREGLTEAGPLAFSPDGRLLAVGYPDKKKDYLNTNRVRIWRVPAAPGVISDLAYEVSAPATGEGSTESLISLAWSADGKYLAAGFEDYRVAVWSSQGMLSFRKLQGSTLPRYLSWAPRPDASDPNLRLALGSLEVWSMALTGGRSERVGYVDDFLPGVYDMQFSPDGSLLALAGYGSIDLRQTVDGSRKLVIRGMDGAVNSIAFSPAGDMLAAACQDGTTRLYQTSNGLYLASVGEATYPLRAVDFSRDGLWLATTGENALVRIYRVTDGMQMAEVAEPYVAYMLRFSPNTDQIASLTTNGVRLRGITVVKDVLSLDWEAWIGGVGMTGMTYSPGGEFLALVGNDLVRVVEPTTGKDVYTLYEPSGALPWAVAFSPDNAFLAVGWSDGQIRIYWAQDGHLMRALQAHPESIRRLTFSLDGRLLASLGEEGAIRIWGVSE